MGTTMTTTMTKKKRPSLRKAINAMCKHCIYDSRKGNGTWRYQTETCTANGCPLYDVRPMMTKGEDNEII